MQLGWFPGLSIRQTSDQEYGQIYVPFVNWTMMLCTLALALGFGSSDRLAGAYGTAVSTTMLLTTLLLFNAMRDIWRWPMAPALLVCAVFLLIDLVFFGANLLKLREGGWIPLVLGCLLLGLMTTWRRGIAAMRAMQTERDQTPEWFLAKLRASQIPRVPGTAIFLSRSEWAIPPVLVHHVDQFKALQQTVVSLTVRFEEYPRVWPDRRAEVKHLGDGIWYVTIRFGFIEQPNVVAALAYAKDKGCPLELDDAVYFASHDAVVRGKTGPRMPAWRRLLFSVMYRNAVRSPDRFDLPAEAFLEIGRQVAV
jgi:KUP system potassium uptake protein